MKPHRPAAILTGLLTLLSSAAAHETPGHADGVVAPEADLEFFTGPDGYRHGGLGVVLPAGEDVRLGLVGHFVREESGGDVFPSLGAEIARQWAGGWQAELFGFGYLPVARQSAWALGARGSRRHEIGGGLAVTPFVGTTFARVRAIEEATDSPVAIGHLMVLGGVTLESGPFSLDLFATRSFFDGESVGTETHVDLEEMTHLAIYENNDGFADRTAGAQLGWKIHDRLTLRTGYAWIGYEDCHRHSISITPHLTLTERLTLFGGVQFLRGAADAELYLAGVSVSF